MTALAARLFLILPACLVAAGQTESPVVGAGNFLHIVSDLDQSIAFYHDTLGLEITGPPGEHKFTDAPVIANLYGVPGKQFRVAVLKIPGTVMGIELVQWGAAQEPKHRHTADPGVVTLMLRVTKPDKPAKARLYDPDGFPVEVEQAASPGADLSVSVPDVKKAIGGVYSNLLGLKADGDWLTVPGPSPRLRFTKSKGAEGSRARFPEPGRGMLRLRIHDFAALESSLKMAGATVITTGGKPVTLPQGPRVIIVRDPNGLYMQLMEAR